MNQVETWFGVITKQAIRRGTFNSVAHLIGRINDYVANWNSDCKPFTWTAGTASILAKVKFIESQVRAIAGHYPNDILSFGKGDQLRTRLIRQHSALDNRHEHSIAEISHRIRTTRLRDTRDGEWTDRRSERRRPLTHFGAVVSLRFGRSARVRSAHPASDGFVEHDTAAQLAALI